MRAKEQEFAEIVREHQGLLIKVSRMYTNTLEDQEDLFQEIVLQLWRSYDSFQGQSKLSTWMYRVALNTSITIFRKKTRSPHLEDLSENYYRIAEQVEPDNEQVAMLYRVIKTLPEVERAVVMMYLDDLPYRDIAANLGISEGNARVKMNRLKKTIKTLMEKHGGI